MQKEPHRLRHPPFGKQLCTLNGGRIAVLIEAAGCQVVYLPAYSPDLNRIEQG